MSEWQPIDTAPKDTFILVYCPWAKKVRLGRYNTKRGYRKSAGWGVQFGKHPEQMTNIAGEPTHWMPLPPPPSDHHDAQGGGMK